MTVAAPPAGRTPASGRRPAALRWLPIATAVGALSVAAAAAVVVGFLVLGVLSGEVRLGELFATRAWSFPSGRFGALAMVWGTVAVSGIALLVAAPLGWAAAITLRELTAPRLRRPLRAAAELLAAVPSIVYGLLGVVVLRPLVSEVFDVPGGDSLLAAGLLLAVMVLPTVIAVSVDALDDVPAETREAAAALGLRRTEVVRAAVLPMARPGLVAAALLGLARALGETVAVFLVIGRADGRLPSLSGIFDSLVRPGQTLTTKLGGPEPLLAGTAGPHWAALCALGLLLLFGVAALTALGQTRRGTIGWIRPSTARGARPARVIRDRVGVIALRAALAVPVLLIAGVLVGVLLRGHRALDPTFWLTAASGASGGGIRDQVLGTMLLVVVAGFFAAPLGLALGLVLGEYTSDRTARWLRTATVTLGGVPSILLGLAGYWLFSGQLNWGKSWLAGGIVLAVVAIPVVALAVAARLDQLPAERREAAHACGLRRSQLVRSVLVPHVRPGLVTGLLLGLARAAGETAPLLFTATVFAGAAALPSGVVQAPVVSLPTHLFALAQDAADSAALEAAWGSALALVGLAGSLLIAATLARRRLEVAYT